MQLRPGLAGSSGGLYSQECGGVVGMVVCERKTAETVLRTSDGSVQQDANAGTRGCHDPLLLVVNGKCDRTGLGWLDIKYLVLEEWRGEARDQTGWKAL